jgi:levansucrase
VQAFYTASGRDNGGIDPSDALQRLAMATGKIHANKRGVWFTGFRNHKIIAEADGRLYQTLEQSQEGPIIYAFRDPFAFRNPDDGRTYILFEGNTGGVAGEYQCQERDLGELPAGHTVPADSRYYTGNMDSWRRPEKTCATGDCSRRACRPTASTSRPNGRT